jgi:N-acylglucosamine-6-phosphate 2-epimerase
MSRGASLLAAIRGGLIVSCQARPGEPLYGSQYMAEMAKAALMGGACGIRANGAADISAIKAAVPLPIIGINKRRVPGYSVFITSTAEDAAEVAIAGSSMIAVECTEGTRPPDSSGHTWSAAELADYIHIQLGLPAMADVSTFEEGLAAQDAGFDCVATTLSGYTPHSPALEGPDLALVERLSAALSVPVIAEGRILTPDDARRALEAGAWAVVVGKAITMPHTIVERFAKAIGRQHP